MADFETQPGSLFFDQNRDFRVVQFAHLVAAFADQELAGMGFARPPASDEGIQGFDLVYEAVLDKKIQRPVYGWRRRAPFAIMQLFQNIVSPGWGVTVPDDLQHPPAQRREP